MRREGEKAEEVDVICVFSSLPSPHSSLPLSSTSESTPARNRTWTSAFATRRDVRFTTRVYRSVPEPGIEPGISCFKGRRRYQQRLLWNISQSEWQDLNLRSPAPEAGGHSRLACTPSFGSGGEGSEKIGRNTTRTLPVYFSRGRGGAKSKQFGGTLLTPHSPSSESTPTRIRTWNLAFEARDDHPFQHQGIQIQRLASNQQPPRSERGVLPVELLWKKIEAGCHRSDIRPRL